MILVTRGLWPETHLKVAILTDLRISIETETDQIKEQKRAEY